MESYSVEAILSAVDKNFTSTMDDAGKSMGGLGKDTQKTNTYILDIAKGVGVFKLVDAGVGMVKDSLGGAISRFDTLNKYPTVMQALGYSAQDVDKSMQKLSDGIEGLPTSLDEIVASTQQFAISTGSLEKGTDTAVALNNAFLASGASTANASRGMEQYRQMLGRGEVDMQSWRSVLETMPIGMDKVAKSFREQGVNSTNDLYDALKDGNITFDEFNNRLIELNEGVGGFADLAQKNSKGIATSFANIRTAVVKNVEKMIRAFDEGLQGAGFGSIAENLDKVKGLVNDVFGVIIKAVPPALKMISDLINTIKPFTPVILGLLAAYTTYQSVMSVARTAQAAYNGALAITNALLNANPIGLIITAIILLVGTVIYLWKTNEDFRNAVINIWKGIQGVITKTVERIQNAWTGTKDWFVNAWNGVGEFFSKLWKGLTDTVSNAVEAVQNTWDGVKEFFSGLWDGIKQGATDAWESLTSTVTGVFSKIIAPFEPLITWFGSLWDSISTMAGSAWEIIKTVIMGPVLLLIDLVTGNFEQLKEDAAMLWTTLTTNISTIVTTFVSLVVGYYKSFVETIVNLWNNLISRITSLWTMFTTWLSQTVDNIVNSILQTWKNFKQSTIDLFNNTIQTVQDAWDSFKKWIVDLVVGIKDSSVQAWESLKQSTVDTFNNLVSGAQQAWNDLVTSVSDAINSVFEWFDKLKNINLLDIGKAIIDGFVGGLKDAWETGKDFIGGIGDWIRKHKGPIQYDRKLLIPAGNAIMDGLNNGLINGFGTVQSTVGGIGDRISDAINFDYSADIGADVARANRNINSEVTHQVSYGQNKQSATFNIKLGNQQFKAFVSDISEVMGGESDINLSF